MKLELIPLKTPSPNRTTLGIRTWTYEWIWGCRNFLVHGTCQKMLVYLPALSTQNRWTHRLKAKKALKRSLFSLTTMCTKCLIKGHHTQKGPGLRVLLWGDYVCVCARTRAPNVSAGTSTSFETGAYARIAGPWASGDSPVPISLLPIGALTF